MYSRHPFHNPFESMHPFTREVLGGMGSGSRDELGAHPFVSAVPMAFGLTAAVGMADNVLGEDNMFNSNEFIANGAVAGTVPIAGGIVGAAIGAAGNKARQGHRLRKVHKTMGMPYEARLSNMDGRAMGAAATTGAMIGAGAAMPGAMRFMAEDVFNPEEQSLGRSLSMKDRDELNALLDAHSDGPAF